MSKIFDEFQALIQSRTKYVARGFNNINCPACGDKRARGGFAKTETGGFRYFCYNGGCTYNSNPTGWEPGNGLNGRVRDLFEMLGGSIRDIPISELRRAGNNRLGGRSNDNEVATRFSEIPLPKDSLLLEEAAEEYEKAFAVLNYLNGRSPMYMETGYPFVWTPEYADYVILPFIHYNQKVVGYMGRNIHKKSGSGRFIQKAPSDYMFNQHLLSQDSGSYIIVTESPMEALLLQGVGVRENRLTRKQINLLKSSGRIPILVPDQYADESKPFLDAAKENDWFVSVPDFGGKDAGVSIQNKGLLWTAEQIMSEKTKDYGKTKFRMRKKS